MAITEALRLLISSDSAQAQRDLKKLGLSADASTSALGKLKASAQLGFGIGAGAQAFDTIGAAAEKLGTFAVSQIQSAVGAASSLQQSAGAVEAVFGRAANTVQRFGESAADAVGLSTAQYLEQSAVLGAILKGLGQTQEEAAATSASLITLGADLSAAFGGTTSDAVLSLQSALRGEFERVERYGISLRQAEIDARVFAKGLDTSTASVQQQSRSIAALEIITERTGDVQGQFAREVDTFVGQQARFTAELENARAELGEALLPAMTELVRIGREGIVQIDLLGVAFGNMASDVQVVADLLPFISTSLLGFGRASQDAGSKVDSAFRNALATVPGLGPSIVYLTEKMKEAREETERNDAIGDAFRDLADGVREGQLSLEQFAPALAFLPPSLREAAAELFGLGEASDAAAGSTKSLADQIKELEKEAAGLAGVMFGADKAQSAFYRSLESGGSSAASSGKKLERAYRSIEDAQRSLADSQKDLEESLISRFLVGLGASSDEITLGQIAERDATRGLVDAKRDLADAQERLNKLREVDSAGLLDAEAAYIQAQRDFVDAEKSGDVVQLNRAKADLIRTEKELGEQRDPTTVADLAQAEQDVAAAQDAVLRAEIDAVQSRKELNELINRGKEGSRDLAEANKQVEAAQRRVEDSERSLVDANDALNESTTGLGGAVKTANQRFEEGVTAADTWLRKLIDNKATPQEFSTAVAEIYGNLKAVADQAGETKSLDDYLLKISSIYAQLKNVSEFGNFAPGGFSNDPANAFESQPDTKVVLNVDGRAFGEIVVAGLVRYQSSNGPVPIRVSG